MRCMFSAFPAVLAALQLIRRILFVLHSRVIFVLALCARKKYYFSHCLLQNLGDDSGAYRPSTFPDRKSQFLFHRYRRYQFHRYCNIVTWHHHLDPLG